MTSTLMPQEAQAIMERWTERELRPVNRRGEKSGAASDSLSRDGVNSRL